MSTGEDVPRGHSIRARTWIIEISPGAVNWQILSECQREAAEGVNARVMAAYLHWLAPRYEKIVERLADEIQQLREQASSEHNHKRTPDIVANFAVGLRYFLAFATEVKAIDQEQADTLWREAWKVLAAGAQAQAVHHAANEPAQRFLELLTAAITCGRAHIAAPDGSAPEEPMAWGWREKTIGTGEYQRNEWQPQGERIGWLDGDALYVEPDTSFAVAQQLARDQGESIPITPQTMRKRLKGKGYLASCDTARETLTVRRKLEGNTHDVLHLARALIANGLSGEQKPDKSDSANTPEEGEEEAEEANPEKPDICEGDFRNPTATPTTKGQGKPNGYDYAVGNVGKLSERETCRKPSTTTRKLSQNAAVGNGRLASAEIPTAAPKNPTATDDGRGISLATVEEVFPGAQVVK
jgi:hypothetical protein